MEKSTKQIQSEYLARCSIEDKIKLSKYLDSVLLIETAKTQDLIDSFMDRLNL